MNLPRKHVNLQPSARKEPPGKPPSPVTSRRRGGASVVVRARESRVHGEGGQLVSAAAGSQEQAMYVATKDDRLWLLNAQRKLYARSWEHPDYQFEKLWGLVTDPRNLRIAFDPMRRNRGARTARVDRISGRPCTQ